jgi:hypothetical protein
VLQSVTVQFHAKPRGIRWAHTTILRKPSRAENQVILAPIEQVLGRSLQLGQGHSKMAQHGKSDARLAVGAQPEATPSAADDGGQFDNRTQTTIGVDVTNDVVDEWVAPEFLNVSAMS